jgi:hypothetical protein
MNKVSRLLGSTVLATGLIFGGSTGVAFANDNDSRSSYDRSDRHDNDKNRHDRDNDRRKHDNDRRHHNDYKYLLRCSNGHGHHWYEWSYSKYDNRRHCDVVLRVRY